MPRLRAAMPQLPHTAPSSLPPRRSSLSKHKESRFHRAATLSLSSRNGFSTSLSPSWSPSASPSWSPWRLASSSLQPGLAANPPTFSMASSSLLPPSLSAIEQAMVTARSTRAHQGSTLFEKA
ncbi:hypothetical protein ZWY2020_037768 [Hordeum vulgare]|nr:hypothetical protein ZWY2020_037768 [Hordeum vulgare]